MRERLRSSSGLASSESFNWPWKDGSTSASLACEPGVTFSRFVKFIAGSPLFLSAGEAGALAGHSAVARGDDAEKCEFENVEHHHPDQAVNPDRDDRRRRNRADTDAQHADGDGNDLRRHNGPEQAGTWIRRLEQPAFGTPHQP